MNPGIKKIFFVVGAQRSGTTYLYHMLDAHPEICMARPVSPEPKFFLSENATEHIVRYEKTFYSHADSRTRIFGEKSTSYCEYDSVAARIKSAYPASFIIFLLRNPVDRAISNYRFSVVNGFETRSLQEVFLQGKPPPKQISQTSANPFNYIDRGDYQKYIRRYLQHFESNKILILVLEKLTANQKAIQEIYRYLGVDDTFVPANLDKMTNLIEGDDYKRDREVEKKLSAVFEEKIRDLEKFLSLDLSLWKMAG